MQGTGGSREALRLGQVEEKVEVARVRLPRVLECFRTHSTALTLVESDSTLIESDRGAQRSVNNLGLFAAHERMCFGPLITERDGYALLRGVTGAQIWAASGVVKEANKDVEQHGVRACTLAKVAAARESDRESDGRLVGFLELRGSFDRGHDRNHWNGAWYAEEADRQRLLAETREQSGTLMDVATLDGDTPISSDKDASSG